MKKRPKGEPRYSAAEIRDRIKEIEALRRKAVASWKADKVGANSIVIMTFEDYLNMRPLPTPPTTPGSVKRPAKPKPTKPPVDLRVKCTVCGVISPSAEDPKPCPYPTGPAEMNQAMRTYMRCTYTEPKP